MSEKIPFSKHPSHENMSPGKNPHARDRKVSLLKRNELLLIFFAALLVTAVVFFVFFRSPEDQSSKNRIAHDTTLLEERIRALESKIEKMESVPLNQIHSRDSSRQLLELEQKISRVESGVMLKVDTLLSRTDTAEQRISRVEKNMETFFLSSRQGKDAPESSPKGKKQLAESLQDSGKTSAPSPDKSAGTARVVKKKPVENLVKKPATAPVPNKEQKPGPAPMFHTVQKGETLWSISQKYKTTVDALRKLNHLTKDDPIYTGISILVR